MEILRREPTWLCLAPALLLLPFLGKAFHIDDPLFVDYARAIASAPASPFLQPIDWEWPGTLLDYPHPLGWPYLLAAARAVTGETEWALHLVSFAAALLGLQGMAMLARRVGVSALCACTLLAGSSAFLALGSTIMPDVALTGFAIAAVARLAPAVDEGRAGSAVVAGLCAGAAMLTRFSGGIIVGLLFLYPVVARRFRARSFLAFAVALAVVGAYELWAIATTGSSHFLHAAAIWTMPFSAEQILKSSFDQVVHLGAQLPLALLPVVALALRGDRRGLWIAILALVAAMVLARGDWPLMLFAWPALVVLADAAAAIVPALRGRDALQVVLAVWMIAGTFIAVRYVHVAAKYALFPLPAGILWVLAALRGATGAARRPGRIALGVSLAATVVVGVLVAWSDYRFANGYRDFFADARSQRGKGYHAGQWGLRYYAERAGLERYRGQALGPDDRLIFAEVVPKAATPAGYTRLARVVPIEYPGPFAITSPAKSAGFYSNFFGRYPFVPAAKVQDRIFVLRGLPAPAPSTTLAPL